jgi:hypothetical protein
MDSDSDPPGDPAAVHPEYDRLTPENADEWSDDQIAEYKRRKQADLHAEAEENSADLAAEEREALKRLRSATDTDDHPTETVTIGDDVTGEAVDLEVSTKVTGRIEQKFDRITEEQQKETPRIENIKGAVIDCITALIADGPEPDSDPVRWDSRALWEAYYLEEGSEGLMGVFETISKPALDRYEELGNSRGRTRRSTSSR